MKIFALTLLATLALVAAAPLTEENYQSLFTSWAEQHGKTYETTAEFFHRYETFKTNLDYVHEHQTKEIRTFELAMNEFGDLTNDEFRTSHNMYVPVLKDNRRITTLPTVGLPTSVDWPSKGVVTPVKNQGQCGSCWAFSTTGSTEAAHAIKTGNLISLSEQELVDCSKNGNQGCSGGAMTNAFQWIIQNGGLCTESAYPYTAADGTCQKSSCTSAVTISSFNSVTANSLDQLQASVAQQPVSVAVDAGGLNWQFYSGGVMTGSCGTQLDHGVLAAGYGSENGSDYWLVKNSWGASWGESGYVKLSRTSGTGTGMCGIAMDASYPIA